jgi:hypothetical protein
MGAGASLQKLSGIVDFVGSAVVGHQDRNVTLGGIHNGVADESCSLGRARVAAAVAADVSHSVGAVAAGWIGEGLQDAGLNFVDVKDVAAADAHLRDVGQQGRGANQDRQSARTDEEPRDKVFAARGARAFGFRWRS